MWDAKGVSALKFHGQSQPFGQCSVGKYAEQGRRGIQTVFGKMQRTPNIEEKRAIAFQVMPVVKKRKPICQCRRYRRLRLDTWVGMIPRVGNRNPLQYYLENSTDRGAWWAIVHGVVKRRTRQHTFTRTIAGIWNSEKKGEDKKGCFAWRAALLSRM